MRSPASLSLLVARSLSLVALVLAGCGLFPAGGGKPPVVQEVHPVRLSAVGYFPDRSKVATVVLPEGSTAGDLAGMPFDIKSGAGDVLWSGTLGAPITDALTAQPVWLADFSELRAAGEDLYVDVPGVGRSTSFRIATDAYDRAYRDAMRGFYGQRCGTAVALHAEGGGDTWKHAICHTHDAYLTYLTGETSIRPSLGGWHDAGDYGKYVTNGAFTVGMLLAAWQRFQPALEAAALDIPEHGGAIPDFLAEVKWELDWLLTTQQADGGAVHKVTALNFEGFISPEGDSSPRYYTGVGTSATGDVVAVMAAAARIYQPYDADFAARALAAAQLGYAFLQANPSRIFPDASAFHTGGYGDSNDSDERLWAAAELWETTGDAAVLADLETRLAGVTRIDNNFDWGNVGNLGVFTYALSAREGRNADTLAAVRAAVVASGDALVATAKAAPYGRALASYWWGSNGAVARTSMNLVAANAIAPDVKYLDAVTAQVDHLYGRNAYDRSQVTGLGYNPPMNPHHRPSAADLVLDPWPGLLVGGQDKSDSYNWTDTQGAANLNEIAVNWNGALVFATASFLSR